MRVEVSLFAVARQLAGHRSAIVELASNGTVSQLRLALAEAVPALADLLPRVMIAVNSEYADDSLVIPEEAEVAVIPPVSGGGHG